RCRTAKPTVEWTASSVQRPGASGRFSVETVVEVMGATFRPAPSTRETGVVLVPVSVVAPGLRHRARPAPDWTGERNGAGCVHQGQTGGGHAARGRPADGAAPADAGPPALRAGHPGRGQ